MEPKEPKKKLTIKLRKRTVREKPEPAQEVKAKPARGKAAVKARVSRFRPRRKAPLPGVVEGMSGGIPTVGPAVPPGKPAVSQELLDMLAKLSTWKPRSDLAVLEAATRLAQAAREKVDYPKESGDDVLQKAMWSCLDLPGKLLARDNGVCTEYDYVMSVTEDRDNSAVVLETLHLFRRSRVGEQAMGIRTISVPAGSVMAVDPEAMARVRRRRAFCPLPGYDLMTPGAGPLDPFLTTVEEIVNCGRKVLDSTKSKESA